MKFDPQVVRRIAALTAAAVAVGLVVTACQSVPTRPPIANAPHVDLTRYMGDWYVIASIPTFIETHAYDAVESYALRDDGRIATTFTYRDGSFEAPLKTSTPVGTVVDHASNAIWTMQFIWPLQADYRIVQIDPGYNTVIIGREKRDYVWIMARTPTLPDAEYQQLVDVVAAQGYDISKLRKVPQLPRGRAG